MIAFIIKLFWTRVVEVCVPSVVLQSQLETISGYKTDQIRIWPNYRHRFFICDFLNYSVGVKKYIMSSDWRQRSGKWTGRWRLQHNWGWPGRTAMSLQPSMATPSCTTFRVRLCRFGWLILCQQQQTVPSPKVKQPRKTAWHLKISRTLKLGKCLG